MAFQRIKIRFILYSRLFKTQSNMCLKFNHLRYLKNLIIIVSLIGGIISILGVTGPWISMEFYKVWLENIPGSEDSRLSVITQVKMSPFILSYSIKHLQSDTITRFDTTIFYNVFASSIGVTCIVCAITNLIATIKEQLKIVLISGALVLTSTQLFFLVLPNNISKSEYIMLPHWYTTILGGFIILLSLLMKYLYRKHEKNIRREKIYEEWSDYFPSKK